MSTSSPLPHPPLDDDLALERLPNERLEAELVTQAGRLAAGQCTFVLLAAELDARGCWADDGLRSAAHWLSWHCGLALPAAREQVRVGRAIRSLPAIRAAFGRGQLSYSKVRALTRVATPELEASLLEMAEHATASQLEQIVASYRRAAPDEGLRALALRDRRGFHHSTDADGMVVLSVRLSPEEGAVVLAAVEAARQRLWEDHRGAPGGGGDVSAETSGADALVALCESALVSGTEPASGEGPVASVLVHVDQAVLADPTAEGCSHVEGVGAVSAHTAQRLACDAAVATVAYRPDGTVVPEGRTRQIPASLRRAVLARDQGCRWPGCDQKRFVDVHHVVFVARGGRTRLDNLVSLCRNHHRLVHEGGFRLSMDSAARVQVTRPDGKALAMPQPPPVTTPPLVDAGPLWAGTGERFNMVLTVDALLCPWYPPGV